MKFNMPKNENYAAMVIKVTTLIPVDGLNNLVRLVAFNSSVLVSKDTQIGELGVFFPLETSLSDEFLYNNNLYIEQEKNKDTTKKGFFNYHGRVRAVRFKGVPSSGFYMPISSLSYCCNTSELVEGDTFDEIKGHEICHKYIPKNKKETNNKTKKERKAVKVSRLVDNQFRLHFDTSNFRYNAHKLSPDDMISVSSKLNGTSFVAGKILANELSWQQKLAIKLPTFSTKKKKKWKQKLYNPLNFITGNLGSFLSAFVSNKSHYELIWSSRKVIKNAFINANPQHYYDVDIWGIVAEELKDVIPTTITIYGEIVGFLPSGAAIQSIKDGPFDYGCAPQQHEKYIYRMTFTNNEGKVFEFSWLQMVEFCKEYGLKTPPLHYYGKAKDMFPELDVKNHWNENFLAALEAKYMLDQDCPMCYNKMPFEGICISIDSMFKKETFKLKTFRFLQKAETEQADANVLDIETEQSESESEE